MVETKGLIHSGKSGRAEILKRVEQFFISEQLLFVNDGFESRV
jgi:hypothetical protein